MAINIGVSGVMGLRNLKSQNSHRECLMKKMSPFILFLCFSAYCMDPDTVWKIQTFANSKNISINQELIRLETIHDTNIIREISSQYYSNLGECYNSEMQQASYEIRNGARKIWGLDTIRALDTAKYAVFRKPIFLKYQDFADFVTLAANRKRLGSLSIGEILLANLIRPQQETGLLFQLMNKFHNADEQEKKIYSDWEFIKKFEKID